MIMKHRWSGWPSAYCIDCGVRDPLEAAIESGDYDPATRRWAAGSEGRYSFARCTERGSNRHHPFGRAPEPRFSLWRLGSAFQGLLAAAVLAALIVVFFGGVR
jgi:hypothetical protein